MGERVNQDISRHIMIPVENVKRKIVNSKCNTLK